MDYSKELIARFKQFEGDISWMYLDTKGNVTVGVGHFLSAKTSAANIAFARRSDGASATIEEKTKEWNTTHQMPPGKGATYYKKFAKIDLSDSNTLLLQDIANCEAALRRIYSAYDAFPTIAKEGLLDIVFNVGEGNLRDHFPKFNISINAQDWKNAAEECHRVDVSEDRNKSIKQLFLDA